MNNLKNLLLRFFVIFLLLNSQLAFAIADDAPLDAVPTTLDTGEETGEPKPGSFECSTSSLSPEEAQQIQNLLRDGFVGRELLSNDENNTDRDILENNTVILTSPDDNTVAAKVELPNQKFKPEEMSHFLNTYITGPFSFGVVLDDTLRAGRCSEYDKDCAVVGENLSYRNSGEGIVENTKNIFSALKDAFSDSDKNSQFTEKDKEVLLGLAELQDLNSEDATVKTLQRIESEMIANSILTNSFTSNLSTNCMNDGCTISTYSMFDKYFNAWISAEMVFSSFGPALLYRSKKLFKWAENRNLTFGLDSLVNKVKDSFYSRFATSGSFAGQTIAKRTEARMQKYGFRDFWNELGNLAPDGSGGPLIKTTEFDHWWGKQILQDGYLGKIKSAEKRSEFVKFIKDIRTMVRGNFKHVKDARGRYEIAVDLYGATSPAAKSAYIDFGREYSKYIGVLDDMDGMGSLIDIPYWLRVQSATKLFDKGVYDASSGQVVDFIHNWRPIRVLVDKFRDTGSFKFSAGDIAKYGNIYGADDAGNLLLYTIDDATTSQLRGISYSNVKAAVVGTGANVRQGLIKTDFGEIIPNGPQAFQTLQSRMSGNGSVLTGAWVPSITETPEQFVRRISNPRVWSNVKNIESNLEKMMLGLREQNFTSRRYWNLLDKLFAQEDELIKTYFSWKGGLKLTAFQYGYWYTKKAGIPGFFGIEDLSAYMIPDTWKNITISHDQEKIYNNAYIDFFANEGSDDGDMFMRVINNMPWAIVYRTASKIWEPAEEMIDNLSKSQHRTEVENIAFYITGPNSCPACSINLKSTNLEDFSPAFIVNTAMHSYILEDAQSEEAKKKGQLLIAYAAHANLEGKTGDKEGDEINIADAEKEDESCLEAVANSNWSMQWIPGMKGRNIGPAVAGVIGGVESITYAAFFWGGVFSSVWMQTTQIPKFRDCVDTEEGYFVHYYAPALEEKENKDMPELSTEKATDFLSNLKDTFVGSLGGDSNSMTRELSEDLGSELDKFVGSANKKNIVQATLNFSGLSSGSMEGLDLFYFWCGEGCKADPSAYREEGKTIVKDDKTGIAVTADYEKGQLLRDGIPIIDNPDHIRLMSIDSRIPAEVIPQNLTLTCIPDSNSMIIEVNARGEAKIVDEQLLQCIKEGVLEQTGLPMESDRMIDVFGVVNSVVTTTHPNVKPNFEQILAEGTPRKIAEGPDSSIIISGDNSVRLSKSNDSVPDLGDLTSIQFKNGVIVAKPNGCLLVWLKHHENGILSQNDVKDLKTELTHEENPETGCPEPALNFEVQADPESDYAMAKADQFNTSLEKMGPFNIFETPTKRYMLYMGPAPECEEHLRIIDKETGEITDLVGTTSATPDGIKFTDENGKEHTLDFTAKDGVPMITYNDEKPELLTSAQGRNGSFWYDPKEGLWYAENGQLLPLLDAFRQGISTQVGPNGNVTSTAAGNVLNLELGGDKPDFLNLPSLPEDLLALILYLLAIISCISMVRTRKIRIKKKH